MKIQTIRYEANNNSIWSHFIQSRRQMSLFTVCRSNDRTSFLDSGTGLAAPVCHSTHIASTQRKSLPSSA